jgi:uncharacterized protein YyaL (SSP411 family)
MLYDNALLARLYLHAFQITGKPLYRRITEETLDYVLREMTDSGGGFYSAQDADSEGEEGKFFVWTPEEIMDVLGEEDGRVFSGYFGVTSNGNFEGKNILNVPRDPEAFAAEHQLDPEQLDGIVARGRTKLLEVRDLRVHPLLDDKVLASWNGLMLRSFAEAGAVLDRADYLEAAVKNAEFLTTVMCPQGRLLRTYRNGEAKLLGYLEDYSCVADGLIALYEATLDLRWLENAVTMADSMIELFWDEATGGFYDTGSDHEALVIRPRDVFDNAQPCGGSVASDALLKLAVFTGNDDYAAKAAVPLRSLHEHMARSPGGTGHWLSALDFYISAVKEVAVVGPSENAATSELLDTVRRQFLPNKVLMGYDPSSLESTGRAGLNLGGYPLLEGRGMVNGQPTAYVCQNYVCQLPVTEAGPLLAQLKA